MPEVPEDMGIELAEFGTYPKEVLEKLNLPEQDLRILREVGFPTESAPFLSFSHNVGEALILFSELNPGAGDEFECYKYFGHNGTGDPICIDERDGSIVSLDHESGMTRRLYNSSLTQFAETLCLLAEAMHGGTNLDFMNELLKIDEPAAGETAIWATEHSQVI
ncbi:SUKH-4 family immunity protein [Roseibacillus persicicus]|uniref:Uncharacterized protein n=2 Tax=Roseibacillus persicicus TaxID=454148 RepID=A0A918WQL0_9BACT|nr:hypothetical protein GCM10007100_40160 [Roseibacillus persicicus]